MRRALCLTSIKSPLFLSLLYCPIPLFFVFHFFPFSIFQLGSIQKKKKKTICPFFSIPRIYVCMYVCMFVVCKNNWQQKKLFHVAVLDRTCPAYIIYISTLLNFIIKVILPEKTKDLQNDCRTSRVVLRGIVLQKSEEITFWYIATKVLVHTIHYLVLPLLSSLVSRLKATHKEGRCFG